MNASMPMVTCMLVLTVLLGLLVSLTAGVCRNIDPISNFENCVRKYIKQSPAECQADMETQATCVRDLNQNCFNNSEISDILNEQLFRDAAKYACDNLNDVRPDALCFGRTTQNFWECFYGSGDTTNKSPTNVCSLIPKLLNCSAQTTGTCSTGYMTYERKMFPSRCGGDAKDSKHDVFNDAVIGLNLNIIVAILCSSFSYFFLSG